MAGQGSGWAGPGELYEASALHASDTGGSVEVRVGSEDAMRVWIAGPPALVARVGCQVRGEVLYICGRAEEGGRGGGVVATARGRFASAHGRLAAPFDTRVPFGPGGVFGGDLVGSVEEADESDLGHLAILVEMPGEAPVTIDDKTGGRYVIGDTAGPLDVTVAGGAQVTAGVVTAARVTNSSCGLVLIERVAVSLSIAVSRTGHVRVRDGHVDELDVRASGGIAEFFGSAVNARLSRKGGQIDVEWVTGTLVEEPTASSRIRVRVRPGEQETVSS